MRGDRQPLHGETGTGEDAAGIHADPGCNRAKVAITVNIKIVCLLCGIRYRYHACGNCMCTCEAPSEKTLVRPEGNFAEA